MIFTTPVPAPEVDDFKVLGIFQVFLKSFGSLDPEVLSNPHLS